MDEEKDITNQEILKIENTHSSKTDDGRVLKNNNNLKIRSILKERLKNLKPSYKKALPLILVGIICFMAGIGTDRLFIDRRGNKNFNRPGINQKMPGNDSNGRQFNNNKGTNSN